MSTCEKCWADSYRLTYGTSKCQVEKYHELLNERDCTSEEQAGIDAKICPACNRKTIHQITGVCTNCYYKSR